MVAEETWLEALSAILLWDPPQQPTIVIAPHPDDQTLDAGGLIAAQCRKRISVLVIGGRGASHYRPEPRSHLNGRAARPRRNDHVRGHR
jgi:hypothetical protein